MRKSLFTVLIVLCQFTGFTHPGSGIIADVAGQIFFQDSVGGSIWRIDQRGSILRHSDKLGGHWMTLDLDGKFSRATLNVAERIVLSGRAALLVADGGAPIVVNGDGNLYYGLAVLPGDKVAVGITRFTPDGRRELFAPEFGKTIEKLGITGLAKGPNNVIYAACLTTIIKLKTDGTFSTLISPVIVKDCNQDGDSPSPFLRGLDVDAEGNVYAAATGCRCVVKITTEGKVQTVLKAESPWSPTGVALQGKDLYVLEYTNANGAAAEGWRPRIRKLEPGGKVTTWEIPTAPGSAAK